MHRTGYQRPWYKASKTPYGGTGPAYWLMRLTIGSQQAPIVHAMVRPPRTLEEAEAMVIEAMASLRV